MPNWMAQVGKQFKNPLDPLLLRLSKDYLSDADLSNRLGELFHVRRCAPPARTCRLHSRSLSS